MNLLTIHYGNTLFISDRHSLYGDVLVAASVFRNVSGNVSQVVHSVYVGHVCRIASVAFRDDDNILAVAHDNGDILAHQRKTRMTTHTNYNRAHIYEARQPRHG